MIKVRSATRSDSHNISHLLCELSARFISNNYTPEVHETLINSMSQKAIDGYIESGYRYHLAENGNKLVGVVGVRDNAHLYHLFVADEFHRQGVAANLWRVAMNVCIRKGNPGEFTVNSSSYALEVYERFGFVAQSGLKVKKGIEYIPMKLICTGRSQPG
jgi:ribosomal protein S18 acetylase RimI-like enzyme